MPALTTTRRAGAVIAPVAMLALLCGVHTLAARRRTTAVAALPPATPTPAVDRFEAIAAGRSALLRLEVDVENGVLIADHAGELIQIGSVQSKDGVVAACDRALLDDATFWLQLDGRSIALPRPATRAL
jgi:hypothetical protein